MTAQAAASVSQSRRVRAGRARPGRSEERKPTLPERAEVGRQPVAQGGGPGSESLEHGRRLLKCGGSGRGDLDSGTPGRTRRGAVETSGGQRRPQCGRCGRPAHHLDQGRGVAGGARRSGPSRPGRRPAHAPAGRDRRCSGPPGGRNTGGERLPESSPRAGRGAGCEPAREAGPIATTQGRASGPAREAAPESGAAGRRRTAEPSLVDDHDLGGRRSPIRPESSATMREQSGVVGGARLAQQPLQPASLVRDRRDLAGDREPPAQ